MSFTRFSLVLSAALVVSCKAGPDAATPVVDATPESWLGAAPNSWASVDVKGIRAEASLAALVECATSPTPTPAKKSYLAASADAIPCKEQLRDADSIDLWLRREASEPHTALLVVRGATAAATACLDKATPSPAKAITPTATEHVFFGARWPRVYVVGTGKDTMWLLPTGKAAERTRAALASGATSVPSGALPAGTLFRVGGSSELIELVLEEMGARVGDLHGLSSFDIAGQRPKGSSLPFSASARFATKKDADDIAPFLKQATDRLAKEGTPLPMFQAGSTLGVAGQVATTALSKRCAPQP